MVQQTGILITVIVRSDHNRVPSRPGIVGGSNSERSVTRHGGQSWCRGTMAIF